MSNTDAIISYEAEAAVIGAALFSSNECDEAFERLRAEHFGYGVHQDIWRLILSGRAKGFVNLVTIDETLGKFGTYQDIGGRSYLADLVDKANIWTLPANIELVADRAARRSLRHLAQQIATRSADTSEGDADLILADMERGAADIARATTTKPLAVPVGLTALEMVEDARAGKFVGTSIGLQCLDHVTGGIRQDDVWVIGGRSSMGKSVVGLEIASGIAMQGRGVMMFSLEMPTREVQARLIASMAYDRGRMVNAGDDNLRYGDILKGRGTGPQWDRAREAARRLASLPMAVSDVGGLTIDDIRAQAQRQLRAWDKANVSRGAILIDHIGLVKPSRPRNDSKAAETADIVNELKGLAKQLGAPIITLAQINRGPEARQDKRPTMADLNWSGAIEQIADFICLLYRESYYLERSSDPDDKARALDHAYEIELLIAKNRSGPICPVHAFCDVASNVIRDREEAARAYG